MTDEPSGAKLYVDSDWKAEAAREKEQLAAQTRTDPTSSDGRGDPGATGFIELVNILVMQVAVALGGMQGPNGERYPANPAAAKHMIDLLEVLEQKTRGNLTDDEKRAVDTALHELRLQYVQAFSKGPTQPSPPR